MTHMAGCLCKMQEIKMFSDMLKNDLEFMKSRLSRSPSESEICGQDDQTKPLICPIEKAPKFLTTNRCVAFMESNCPKLKASENRASED